MLFCFMLELLFWFWIMDILFFSFVFHFSMLICTSMQNKRLKTFFFIQSEILIAVLFMNMISLISFVLQYKEGSPGVNLVVVVEGGARYMYQPPSISPFSWKSSWYTGNHWWLEQTPLRQSFPPPENYWISHWFLGKTNKLLKWKILHCNIFLDLSCNCIGPYIFISLKKNE